MEAWRELLQAGFRRDTWRDALRKIFLSISSATLLNMVFEWLEGGGLPNEFVLGFTIATAAYFWAIAFTPQNRVVLTLMRDFQSFSTSLPGSIAFKAFSLALYLAAGFFVSAGLSFIVALSLFESVIDERLKVSERTRRQALIAAARAAIPQRAQEFALGISRLQDRFRQLVFAALLNPFSGDQAERNSYLKWVWDGIGYFYLCGSQTPEEFLAGISLLKEENLLRQVAELEDIIDGLSSEQIVELVIVLFDADNQEPPYERLIKFAQRHHEERGNTDLS